MGRQQCIQKICCGGVVREAFRWIENILNTDTNGAPRWTRSDKKSLPLVARAGVSEPEPGPGSQLCRLLVVAASWAGYVLALCFQVLLRDKTGARIRSLGLLCGINEITCQCSASGRVINTQQIAVLVFIQGNDAAFYVSGRRKLSKSIGTADSTPGVSSVLGHRDLWGTERMLSDCPASFISLLSVQPGRLVLCVGGHTHYEGSVGTAALTCSFHMMAASTCQVVPVVCLLVYLCKILKLILKVFCINM